MKTNQLKEFFYLLTQDFPSSGVFSRDGLCYFLRYELSGDLGTMGVATQSVVKYLPLKWGDVALVNDPYSGGTLLSQMTLVTPLPGNLDLLFLVRIGFKHALSMAQNIEEEGLRIPPMPIAENFRTNSELMSAMEAHPLCPQGFRQKIQDTVLQMQTLLARTEKILGQNQSWFTKPTLKEFLKLSENRVLKILNDLPSGDVEIETHLDQGEVLHARLEINEKGLKVDFGGTSPSKRVCLTDSATHGAVLSALLAYLNQDMIINAGLFQLVEVHAPLGCFLNAKYPSPTYKGMTDGVALVAATILKALTAINPLSEIAGSSSANSKIELKFEDGRRFFDFTLGGTGATKETAGVTGASFWVRSKLESSVEEIERLYPMLVCGINIRSGSGGKGVHPGGDGLIKVYEITAPATLTWSIEHTKSLAEGCKGGKPGLPSEISVQLHGQKEKRKMASNEGAMNLMPGDKIFVSSAGGAGWGLEKN